MKTKRRSSKRVAKAAEAYKLATDNVEQQMKRLRAGLDKWAAEAQAEPVDFGHVGSMANVAEDLRQIADMLNNEGEYAPEAK